MNADKIQGRADNFYVSEDKAEGRATGFADDRINNDPVNRPIKIRGRIFPVLECDSKGDHTRGRFDGN